MTYGKCPALSQFVEESARLELSARKGLSVPPAVIGPSGRSHCFRGRIIPARGNRVSFCSKAILGCLQNPLQSFRKIGHSRGVLRNTLEQTPGIIFQHLWCFDQSSLTSGLVGI